MGIITKIPGNPGTGKTTRLIEYLDKEIKKTDPKKIIYITYSNAGADEAQKRIKHPLLYISTMHSMGSRESGISKTLNQKLLAGRKWQLFKDHPGHELWQTMSFEATKDEFGYTYKQNPHMDIIQYSRAKKINLVEAAIQLNLHEGQVDLNDTEQLEQDLKTFKKDTKMVEFTDMIELFIEKFKKGICSDIDIVFLDEAQDLNRAQWDMFNCINEKCDRAYVAGDDDQTIYGFQGADAKHFVELKGIDDTQTESHRVPKKVHKVALKILKQIPKEKRIPKDWFPKNEEGEVIDKNYSLEDIDFTKGQWMLLAQTNKLVDEIGEHFYKLSMRFFSKSSLFLPDEILQAYQTWNKLNNKTAVKVKEAINFYVKFCRSRAPHRHVKHGNSDGQSLEKLDKEDFITLEELRDKHDLLATGSWEQFRIDEDVKNYMKNLLDKGDNLMTDSRIKILTFHGSKGKECDNVVWFPDYGAENEVKPYRGACDNPDVQHRLVFVAVTRTKQKLYLMAPLTDGDYYTIGESII